MKNFLFGFFIAAAMFSLFIPALTYKPALEAISILNETCDFSEKAYFMWGCMEASEGDSELCALIAKKQLK